MNSSNRQSEPCDLPMVEFENEQHAAVGSYPPAPPLPRPVTIDHTKIVPSLGSFMLEASSIGFRMGIQYLEFIAMKMGVLLSALFQQQSTSSRQPPPLPGKATSNPYAPPNAASDNSMLFEAEKIPTVMVPATYEEVPWYRRSGTMTIFILIGLFIPPFLWAACGICLTGEVYNNLVKEDGSLTRWSTGNKVAAIIILGIHTFGILSTF
jgi:hypothetical protein